MRDYKYLIVGGGMSAAAAIKGIREVDAEGSIGVVGAETHLPYKRPPLSKKLWQGKPLEIIWKGMQTAGIDGLDMHMGHTIQAIQPGEKRVFDEAGDAYNYEKLLLVTGGRPKRLPFGSDDVIYYHTLGDYKRLREMAETRQHFAVIGGGFIGSEIAAALAMNGKRVTLIIHGKGIGERLFPADLVRFLNTYYRDHGVEIVTGERAAGLEPADGGLNLTLSSGRTISVDSVVAGIGIEPNTALAREAGLAVDNGVLVDRFLRTSDPDIYAAGDVALYPDHVLGGMRRVEHEDNAITMGKAAGRSMAASAGAGEAEPYDHLPFFYSDLFDLGYEAVGEVDSRMEMVSDWKEPYREGVVYYMRDGSVRGVLLWNVWGQVDAARRLISEPGPFKTEELKGRLPEESSK